MKKLLTIAATLLVCSGTAQARSFHYTCESSDGDPDVHYAFTVNEGARTAKLIKRGPTVTLGTFRVLKVASVSDCGKYGWNLSDNALFCTFTQGAGNLQWRGMDLECKNADTD